LEKIKNLGELPEGFKGNPPAADKERSDAGDIYRLVDHVRSPRQKKFNPNFFCL